MRVHELLTYWEPRRLVYNGLLTVVVAVLLQQGQQWSQAIRTLPWLLLAALLANLCFCLAYPVDLGLQISRYQPLWLRIRPWLFVAGCLEGLALTYLILPEVLKGHL